MHLEILLEEASMESVVQSLLSRLVSIDQEHTWTTHPHYGKQDLLKKLQKTLNAYARWIPEDYRIVIILDQDRDDCIALKEDILSLCRRAGLDDRRVLVRIVVVMLEAWFLGDIEALEKAFPKLERLKLKNKAIYRDPERRPDPADDLSRELEKVSYKEGYLKGVHPLEVAPHLKLEPQYNRARSFYITLEGLKVILGLQ